ncbi:MAG: hypothetical protein QHJ73_16565, partial [Armatimonadota bacterium]|nr:hypothetical protein [Armatimonadota bacterium]
GKMRAKVQIGLHRAFREESIRAITGYLVLILAPIVLLVVTYHLRFQGLQNATAVDHAQLARNVAEPSGFTTHVIRPLSLLFKADVARHPDLYNAPLHPIALGFLFAMASPTDKVVAAFGGAIWLLTLWVLFLTGRQWMGTAAGTAAVVLYGCNVAALTAALGGFPQSLAALLTLLAMRLLVRTPVPNRERNGSEDEDDVGEEEEGANGDRTPLLRPVSAAALGFCCGLAVLTDYLLVSLLVAVGVLVALTQGRWKTLLFYGLGAAVPLVPWMVRNFLVTGSPVFSLFWYELMGNTETYPGDTLWRTLSAPPPSPLEFVFQHPLQTMRKLLRGLALLRETSLTTTEPLAGLLFLGALFSRKGVPMGWPFVRVLAGALVLHLVGVCLFQPNPAALLPWLPVIHLVAAVQFVQWAAPASRHWGLEYRPLRSRLRKTAPYVGFGAVAVFPMVFLLFLSPRAADPMHRARFEPVRTLLPREAVVVSDEPALVAWYGERRAVWLPREVGDFDLLQQGAGKVDAAYISRQPTAARPRDKGDWWFWLAVPHGVYRDLVPVGLIPPEGVLRVRAGVRLNVGGRSAR